MENDVIKRGFGNSQFEFCINSCECKVDTLHPTKNSVDYIFRLYPNPDKFIYYSYIQGKGLIKRSTKNSNDGTEVIPDLLAIENPESLKKFIENYGYFFSINLNETSSIEAKIIFELIHHLQSIINLMSELGEIEYNYEKILSITLFLLLSRQTEFRLLGKDEMFYLYQHEFGEIWNEFFEYDIKNSYINLEEVFDTEIEKTIFDDTIFTNNSIDFTDYNIILNNYKANPNDMKAKVNYLYIFKSASENFRLGIDFLYHFFKEIGSIELFDYKGNIEIKDNDETKSKLFKNKLNKQLQVALIKLAKQTIKEELEYYLSSIQPSYNIDTMSPEWKIDSFLSGLYFAVFYLQPNVELYRRCANPNCSLSFLVKATSSKKKYCQNSCANAMAQRRYRLRERK